MSRVTSETLTEDMWSAVDDEIDEIFESQLLQKMLIEERRRCAERIRELRNEYSEKLHSLEERESKIQNADTNVDFIMNRLKDLDLTVSRYSQEEWDNREAAFSDELSEEYDRAYERGRESNEGKFTTDFLNLEDYTIEQIVLRIKYYYHLGYKNPYKEFIMEVMNKNGVHCIIPDHLQE